MPSFNYRMVTSILHDEKALSRPSPPICRLERWESAHRAEAGVNPFHLHRQRGTEGICPSARLVKGSAPNNARICPVFLNGPIPGALIPAPREALGRIPGLIFLKGLEYRGAPS